MPEERGNLIDTSMASALLKITPRRLQQLATGGWVKSAGRGKWALVPLVHGYIDFLKDENARRTKVAAQSSVQEARAEEIRRRIAREDRQLVDLEEALAEHDFATGQYLASVGGLPARITRNPRERQRIDAICDTERQRLADIFAKRRDVLRTGDSASDAQDEDDAG